MTHPRVRIAFIVYHDNKLLLVRHEKDGQYYYMLPGGGVKFCETIEHCCKREAIEETGLKINMGKLVLTTETISPDNTRHIIGMYFLADIEGEPVLKPSTDPRVAKAEFFSIEEFKNLCFYPTVKEHIIQILESPGTYAPVHIHTRWVD